MGENNIPTSLILDEDESCVAGVLLPLSDRLIFWIGGALVLISAFFLILSFLRFKEVRRQPGDLILGIALSDFILAIHWIIIASWYTMVDNPTFCVINGFIGTLAGTAQYFYSVSFSLYLVVSLRNALKQDKIPRKTFHFLPLAISFIYVIYLYFQNELGKTTVGTCSIKSTCTLSFMDYMGPLLVASYAFIGFYTLWYVHKNASKCSQAHAKRTQFLLYYMKFVLASTFIFSIIAVMNLLTVLSSSYLINSLYNISKLSSPLVLSFIRYNDPLIKKAMIKTFSFKRQNTKQSQSSESVFLSTEASMVSKEGPNQEQLELHQNIQGSSTSSSASSSRRLTEDSRNSEFIFNQIASNLKVCITYTLLSCVLYADRGQRSSTRDKKTVDNKSKNRYKHERIYMISDEMVKSELPVVKEELERLKFNILPGTLKVYAPEVFTQLLDGDKGFLNIQESLDFITNKDEISDASGPGGGKSGEFFFFSKDKKIIIKTVPDTEMKMISNIVEKYENHFRQYPNSLIAKIYGAFTFESTEYGRKFNLIVMKNISGFPKKYVERVYDIKGSRYDREVLKGKHSVNRKTMCKSVLKDLDFEKIETNLNIKQELKEEFLKQIEADSLFFQESNLIDYSFMVFCVNKERFAEDNKGGVESDFTALNPLASLENTEDPGMYYNVGIGDYLQPYNFQKAFERLLKKIRKMNMRLDTSSQNPDYYSKRFVQFLRKLVGQETNQ